MSFFKRGELELLWPFYLDALISPILYIMPAFSILYFREWGYSLFKISILTMMIPLMTIIFQIPTGAIADVYGRKFSVLFGSLLSGLTILLVYFLQNYYLLLIAFALIGIANTFGSSAGEAWITDLIRKERKNLLHDYFAKKRSIDSIGLVISGIIGAFLVKNFGLSIIWIITALSYFLSILLLLPAKEKFRKRSIKINNAVKTVKRQTSKSVSYSKNHPILFFFLIVLSISVFSSVFSGDMAWVTLLQNLGFSEHSFGYLWSLMGVVGIIAPLISLKSLKKNKERKYILISITCLSLISFLIIFVNNLITGLMIIISISFFYQLSAPAERLYFHRYIPSKLRATIGSVENMLMGIMSIIAMPIAGLSIDHIGPKFTILISAIILLPAAIILYLIDDNI